MVLLSLGLPPPAAAVGGLVLLGHGRLLAGCHVVASDLVLSLNAAGGDWSSSGLAPFGRTAMGATYAHGWDLGSELLDFACFKFLAFNAKIKCFLIANLFLRISI